MNAKQRENAVPWVNQYSCHGCHHRYTHQSVDEWPTSDCPHCGHENTPGFRVFSGP